MKIAVGCDQGGIELKNAIVALLKDKNLEVEDFGIYEAKSIDYPDMGKKVAKAVLTDDISYGIVICGTGIGISLAANKVKGIRCALCTNCYMAKMARQHNNANMLALGGRVIGTELANAIVETFLETSFEDGGRHERRVEKIMSIEEDK